MWCTSIHNNGFRNIYYVHIIYDIISDQMWSASQ